MTEYNFMPAQKVAELEQHLYNIEDYIWGDLEGKRLTDNRLKILSDKFTEVEKIIRECKRVSE